MKLSDNFDSRRLRLRTPGSWLCRLGTALAALFIVFASILILAGAASLLSHPAALQPFNDTPAAARIMIFVGIGLFAIGVFMWRHCRRRLRQANGLSLAPHLMKRRD